MSFGLIQQTNERQTDTCFLLVCTLRDQYFIHVTSLKSIDSTDVRRLAAANVSEAKNESTRNKKKTDELMERLIKPSLAVI